MKIEKALKRDSELQRNRKFKIPKELNKKQKEHSELLRKKRKEKQLFLEACLDDS